MIFLWGLPEALFTDNGSEFVNSNMKLAFEELEIYYVTWLRDNSLSRASWSCGMGKSRDKNHDYFFR